MEPFFQEKVVLNHVLAQIYKNYVLNAWYIRFVNWLWTKIYMVLFYFRNSRYTFIKHCSTNLRKKFKRPYFTNLQKKAKIKAHSDKTKDMPRNGLIAFCTFYQSSGSSGNRNPSIKQDSQNSKDFDFQDDKASAPLTRLRFKLKTNSIKTSGSSMEIINFNSNSKNKSPINFDVILYPNSVFVIPLSTNRFYTHEIIPSGLPVDKLPTRLGYVIRCSNTEVFYFNKDKKVYFNNDECLTDMTAEEDSTLRDLYLKENTTSEIITYQPSYSSMNKGDYLKPILGN